MKKKCDFIKTLDTTSYQLNILSENEYDLLLVTNEFNTIS